ncbi:MAG: HAD family hydrolase [Thermoanaerobaculia bacterium]
MPRIDEIRAICLDWGGTLMSEVGGPEEMPMALWPEVHTLPGACELLRQLHLLYPLHIATNANVSNRPMIAKALQRAGLLPYVGEIFCFTELGCRKSEPQFWEFVCAKLGLCPQQLAMLGDSLEEDVLAPRRFGVRAVWFNEGGRHAPPDEPVPTITRLEDFPRAVANLA